MAFVTLSDLKQAEQLQSSDVNAGIVPREMAVAAAHEPLALSDWKD